jgi:hypothetical protein
MPFFLEATILSRMRSPANSRSNWAKDKSTLRVNRPMLVLVLNCWVIETKDTPLASKASTILAKSNSETSQPVDLIDDNKVDLARTDIAKKPL